MYDKLTFESFIDVFNSRLTNIIKIVIHNGNT